MAKVVKKRIDSTGTWKGRPGIIPPLGADFDTALGALLRTPPPPDDLGSPRRGRKQVKISRGKKR